MSEAKTVKVSEPKKSLFKRISIPDLKWYDWVILLLLMGFFLSLFLGPLLGQLLAYIPAALFHGCEK